MNLKNPKNWIKEITLAIMLIIECVVTYCGFTNNWELEVRIALIFASILTLFNEILSVLNKFDKHVDELREESKREHDSIRKGLKLNSNIKSLNEILLEEDNFVNSDSQDKGKVAWIISNDIGEDKDAIDIMCNNLKDGLTYYYVIPEEQRDTIDPIIEKIKSKIKDPAKCKGVFKYIIDEFFTLMPVDVVSFLFYENPNATEEEKRIKGYYCFHEELIDDKTNKREYWYNPINNDKVHCDKYKKTLSSWRKKFDSEKNKLTD